MDKILSREEYTSRIRAVRERFGEVDTNCLIPGSGMEPWILSGQLYADEVPEGLAVYVDEGSYLTLYYHIGAGEAFPRIRCDRPVILEETFRKASGEAQIRAAEGRILAAGFTFYRENLMFAADPAAETERLREETRRSLDRLERQGIVLTEELSPAQQREVLAMWDDCLECGDIPLDHRSFAEDAGQQLLCAVTADGRAAGTWWWKDSRRGACEGRHLVTLPEYRGMGIGGTLLAVCLERLADRGVRQLSTWINVTNEASVRLHGRMGFRPNGRGCIQYILAGKKTAASKII